VDLLGLAPLAIRGRSHRTAIPRLPVLRYVQFAALAATFPTGSSTGFDLTEGLLVTIGD
jgi:hypothetical protein